MALSLRDLAGLTDVGNPALPPVTPEVARLGPTGVRGPRKQRDAIVATDRAILAAQWLAWWERTARRELRPLSTTLQPPHFTAFDRELELQDLVIMHYQDALAWTIARHKEYSETSALRHATRAKDIVEIVHNREHELRRQAGYFRLDISVLPLASPGAWIIAPNSVVVSQSFRDDSAAFRAWFTPVVAALV
jgi:hypothetical protein